MTLIVETPRPASRATDTMRATVFHGPNDIRVESVPKPRAGVGEAVIRVTTTTICGTDIHILKGEYPVRPGPDHRPRAGRRHRRARPGRHRLRDRPARPRRRRSRRAASAAPACPATSASAATATATRPSAAGASATPSTARQAEYLLVPSAQANLTPIPDGVTDEQVVLLADIASTGFSGPESGGVKIGDAVVVFAQGPIGLCADGRRQADGRLAHHRRRQRPGPARDGQADGRRRRARLHPGRRRRRGQATDRRRRRRDRRGARAPRGRSRTRCAACGRAARCRASASTRASSRCRTTRSRPASAATAS